MDRRTQRYVAGRFRDHYRRVSVAHPPAADRREWAYIPWSRREQTTMIRHRALQDLGTLQAFLRDEFPRHVYYSAGRYEDPGAGVMGAKGWQGADLVFDLDADHLPGVGADDDYRSMLQACKEELRALLDLLERDFGFEDLDVIFSGGRGYHVHVRTESVRPLDRRARRDIADYIQGQGVTLDRIVNTEAVVGVGRETPAQRRSIDPERGWSRRIHHELMQEVDALTDMATDDALERLREIDGIGEGRATAILSAIENSYEQIAAGNVDVHPAFLTFVDWTIERATRRQGAAIDEPVTTDVNRLIRLPGSLHGGSGLVARRIKSGTLDLFEPLEHAIPETFRGQDITIDVTEPAHVTMGNIDREYDPGIVRLPEYAGMHLLLSGEAKKVRETRR